MNDKQQNLIVNYLWTNDNWWSCGIKLLHIGNNILAVPANEFTDDRPIEYPVLEPEEYALPELDNPFSSLDSGNKPLGSVFASPPASFNDFHFFSGEISQTKLNCGLVTPSYKKSIWQKIWQKIKDFYKCEGCQ